MTGDLLETQGSRIERAGLAALSTAEGMELFDSALAQQEALLVAARLDRRALGALASLGVLPVVLSALVRASRPRANAAGLSLAQRLAATPSAEHERVVLDLVRGHVADVLGYASPEAVPEQQAFRELGLDSLAAVELRNRLDMSSGLRLPATVAFDYPSAVAIAGHLLTELSGGVGLGAADSAEAELNELEQRLTSLTLDEARRRQVRARLETLLSNLMLAEAADDDGDLDSATADEVFALMDKELGTL